MLDAKDLRIGNLTTNAGGIIIKITPEKISDLSNKLIILNPIELTEEWLLDFGYKQVNTLANGTKVLEKPGLFTVYYKDGIVRFSFYTIDVKFVHKFQNIIYSLTNTELTLKDEK